MTCSLTASKTGQRGETRYAWADKFIAYVRALCNNTKVRGDLRSGLGRPMERCARMDSYLAYRLSAGMSPSAQQARYTVASLIAAEPRSVGSEEEDAEPAVDWWQRPNLGASLARAVDEEVLKPGSAESDLQLMSRQTVTGLQQRLPALTRRLASAGISIDWAVLLVDLGRWQRFRDQVVTGWQEQYYRARAHALAADGSLPPQERNPDAFVDHVRQLCKDNVVRADLRAGLSRPVEQCHRMHAHLVSRLPETMWVEDRRSHYAVASLIAAQSPPTDETDQSAEADDAAAVEGTSTTNPEWWRRPNFGTALAQAVNKKAFKPDAAEDDLHLMARQSAAALRDRLPALTRRLGSTGVPLDWGVLIEDLARWDRAREAVATRWLDAYFHVRTLEDRMNTAEEN